MAKIKLPYFGIHEDSAGTKHLFQDICPDGFNYEGIRVGTKMTTRKLTDKCSHAVIPTLSLRRLPDKHWNVFQKILKDELVQVMLPTPKHSQLVYLEVESLQGKLLEVLACLERMCTPLYKSILPLSETKTEEVVSLLGLTNIHPLVLTGAT